MSKINRFNKIALNYAANSGPHATVWKVERALKNMGIQVGLLGDSLDNVDCIFNIDECPAIVSVPDKPSVYWHIDSFLERPLPQGIQPDTIIFVGGKPSDVSQFPNSIYLPLASDSQLHTPQPVEKEYDIVMVGRMDDSHYGERVRLLTLLSQRYRVHINSEPGAPYADEMSRGKLIFNQSIAENIPMRFFEGMALGCLVTNFIPGMEQLATPYKHFIPFLSDNELLENVAYYLEHDEAREVMATKAGVLASLRHTYEDRIITILSYL